MKIVKKIIIVFVLLLIISIGAYLIINVKQGQINENLFQTEEVHWEFEIFEPDYEVEEFEYQDFSRFMNWGENINIYDLKIDNYEDYLKLKNSVFKNMLDVKEEDFEDNFMIITAIENTSQVGLTVKDVEVDDDTMYIILQRNQDLLTSEEWQKLDEGSFFELSSETIKKLDKTCISYIFPKEMERENLIITRDLLDSEKDYSNEVQISYGTGLGTYSGTSDKSLSFKNSQVRSILEKMQNGESPYIIEEAEGWQDFVVEDFSITKELPEIDFSKWENLGNNFYSLKITDFSEYLKYMNKYNLRTLAWSDFKEIGVILVVRKSSDTVIEISESFEIDNLAVEANETKVSLKVETGADLDVSENFKYPGKIIIVPNYRFLESTLLNVNT